MKFIISCFLILTSCFLSQAQAPPVPPPPGLPIGFEENAKEELKIWNSNSQLQIDASAITENFSVNIYNINGQILLNEKFSAAQIISINATAFAQGIIIVQATTEHKIYTRKLFLK